MPRASDPTAAAVTNGALRRVPTASAGAESAGRRSDPATSRRRPRRSSQRVARRGAKESLAAYGWSSEQPQHAVLGLQQQVGNAAVTRILQRTLKDRPASTDAPWAKKHRPPAKKPAKKVPDIHARVVKVDIRNEKTRITVASGPDQGVQVGMSGSPIQENGRELADFTIEKTEGAASTACVNTIPDEVRRNPNVIIKASNFVPASNEGKEF